MIEVIIKPISFKKIVELSKKYCLIWSQTNYTYLILNLKY